MARISIVVVVLVLLLVGWVLLRSGSGVYVEPGSALVVELSGQYVDAPPSSPFARLFGAAGKPLVGLLSELAKAQRDERIETVVVRIGVLQTGWAKAMEIRGALEDLRESGRRVVAYLEFERYGANLEFLIASAADDVYLAPATRSPFAGLAAEYLFLGGLFEKLGVRIEYERIGRYKSAVESYADREMSEPSREMANALLDSIETQFVSAIASGRGLSPSDVRATIDAAPTTPADLIAAGLADDAGYLDDVLKGLGDPPTIEASDYARVDPAELGFEPKAHFALIYGSGPVVVGSGARSRTGEPVLASRTISDALLDAAEDSEIDAVVFRVDSPGGSALASDIVWHATQEVRKSGKPIIVSFSDVAASGGYYVAAGADKIVSGPATLTGSIGVFVMRPVIGGLLDKVGIGVAGLTRGKHADLYLSAEPLSPGTRELLRTDVEGVYELFVSRVAEGRSLPPETVDSVGRGRVWTGEQALARGLVDRLGGLRTAAVEAREALGLEPDADVVLVPYPPPKPFAVQLREALEGASLAMAPRLPLPDAARRLVALVDSLPTGGPVLVPPLLVEVR